MSKKKEERDLLDILLDPENNDRIIFPDTVKGDLILEQIASIPLKIKQEIRLYCI